MVFKPPKLEDEYAKDSNLREEDVQAVLDWSKKQSHLPEISELQAIFFLHSCYYHIEAAKTTLDNYFTVRTLCPELFAASLNDQILKTQMDITCISFLPKRTPEGYKIIFVRLLDSNTDLYDHPAQIKLSYMLGTLELYMNGTCPGIVFVLDLKPVNLGHLAKQNLNAAKKFLYYVQEAMPYRMISCHLINLVPWIDKGIAFIKPFMKKELMDLLHYHSSMDSLYKYVPQDCLPVDLGGAAPSFQELQQQTNDNIIDNFDFFLEHQQQKVDESKRMGKSRSDLFGMEGSFKKLEFD